MPGASPALRIHAGRRARARLRERGLRPEDVRVIPAAAGGPKGLVLNPLDRFIFGHWLPSAGPGAPEVHLLGASIGAWRMATACLARDADATEAEFVRLAHDYTHQHYENDRPGKRPSAAAVSRGFAQGLADCFGGREREVLSHPRLRLHVFTSRGRHLLLAREGRVRTPLGYLGAFAANTLIGRRALGGWLERVVFSDPRALLPMPLSDFRSRQVDLGTANLLPAIQASCAIPFWLQAVADIPGAPGGAYWDGGITDYHLHLNYAAMLGDGLVLYPHFQRQVIPGWLDKRLERRHAPSAFLDNVVLLVPDADWVRRTLPNAKLPDRDDFTRYGNDVQTRAAVWQQAIAESERLRDEFAQLCAADSVEAQPL
jgi:hypothetical protein